MKQLKSKQILSISALLVASAFGSVASAHDVLNQSLGAGDTVDFFTMTCSSSGSTVTRSAVVAVKAKTGSGATAIVRKLATGTANYPTAVSLDNTLDANFSPLRAATPGGTNANGTYEIYVTKTGTAAATYDLRAHCMSGTGGTGTETGTAISAALQNQ
jgi:hypothetical protein